jgi:4-hydroxy-3-polyprenylbenzoate decarboxylase
MNQPNKPWQVKPGYADLRDHIAQLEQAGLLHRIDQPVNKDTELHPLVRWQFRGGIPEPERRAFLFTNIVNSKGHRYDASVLVGGIASNPEIYRIAMGVSRVADIGPAWENAIRHPLPPQQVERGPCQEVVIEGQALEGAGHGLESLPIPISTPGFDCAPYLTAACCITRDPDTGVQNAGTYRGQLKSSTRLGVMMLANLRAGGLEHWKKYRARGQKMPIAFVVGCPPLVNIQGPQKLGIGLDELAVAGALAGSPIQVVRAHSVDLLVPAESEVVIEGLVDTAFLEPEGPFGESHGYVALEDFNMAVTVTAITRRRDAILTSFISQVTPSESSVVKRLAYEPLYLAHLRDTLGIRGIRRVALHEPLTNLRKVVFLQFSRGTARTEVWRGLQGAMTLQAAIGKFVIAIDEDIDPENPDAVLWAMSYRCSPATDTRIVPYREPGHGPRSDLAPSEDSAMLIDATMKYPMPPLALPSREVMENARDLWQRLGLPRLTPQSPWHGYTLGDWSEEWAANAAQAMRGEWMQRDAAYAARRSADAVPNSPVPRDGSVKAAEQGSVLPRAVLALFCIASVLLGVFALVAQAPAQGRPVRVIVPYAPGGNIDAIARLYSRTVTEHLGENWLVENISGGNGVIGGSIVAKAAADGRTLLFSADAHISARLVIRNVPYDPYRDFEPISRVARAPLVVVVNPSRVKAVNLRELVAELKANPAQYSFGHSGLGTSPHLGAETLRARIGVDILNVPYRGTGPAVTAVAGGEINMMVVPPLAAMSLVRAGRLRALAVTSPERFEAAAEVPSAEESGLPGFHILNSYGFWGPRELPREVLARLSGLLQKAQENQELRQRLLGLGVSPMWETPDSFGRYMVDELQRTTELVNRIGLKPE